MPQGETRHCGVVMADIAGSVALHTELGDAAARRLILQLRDSLIAMARGHGAGFVKSYGDDLLATFDHDPVGSAARVAMEAQRLVTAAGLQLYCGLHSGVVEFCETDGHADAVGQTINFAARLHKLGDTPGRIFLAEESVALLPAELRAAAVPFGERALKGIGNVRIWTLGWGAAGTTPGTMYSGERATLQIAQPLLLRHGGTELRLLPGDGRRIVGRGPACALRVPDPEPRISTAHLQIEHVEGYWFAQDVSRNGTWLRDSASAKEVQLPYCNKAALPAAGQLCLGRPFAEDAAGVYTLQFEILAGA